MTPDQAAELAAAHTRRDVAAGLDIEQLYVRALGRIEAFTRHPDDVLAAATRAVFAALNTAGGAP